MGDSTGSFASNALKSGGGPSISMIDKSGAAAGGVGTYKGVMLCNRPFAGTEAAAKTGGDGVKSFAVGVVPTTIGVSSVPGKDKIRRKRKETALTKHKRWLAELQKKKDSLEIQYTVDFLNKSESKEKFEAGEKQMRQMVKSILKADNKSSNQADDVIPYADAKSIVPDAAAEKSGVALSGTSKRPAWALTEEVAKATEDRDDEEFEGDEDDLLGFAKGLDFEKYMDDVEIRTMMEIVQKRISDLELDAKMNDVRSAEAEERGAARAIPGLESSDQASFDQGSSAPGKADESLAIAKDILNAAENLKAVHSTQSVAAIYRSAKDAKGDESLVVMCDLEECHPRKKASSMFVNQVSLNIPLVPSKLRRDGCNVRVCRECSQKLGSNVQILPLGTPLILSHDAADGARIEVKNSIQKLPYMNRNPAI